jgi:hypothetical protein
MPLRFFGGSRMAPGVLLSAIRLLFEARQAPDVSSYIQERGLSLRLGLDCRQTDSARS